ncbi:MAG: neutral/alkaline non-lysosomal ceramidase N-terminal domain-containing protein [Pirellulales bacterium]
MATLHFPQSCCRAGVARRDITPPVGIYHRMWGAATHDRSTGVHRPLLATALVLESQDPGSLGRHVLVAVDHCLLRANDMAKLHSTVCATTGTAEHELQIAFSHTHGAGLMDRSREALPGGELIGPYLDRLAVLISEAVQEAVAHLQSAMLVYGAGHCELAAHRDYWDEASQQFVCGFNPQGPTDNTLQLARVEDLAGKTLAVVVNYACHPTTLAWDNTLISPDYIGAMREVVEQAQGGLCVFFQGASGDLGPPEGYVGDPAVADRNGRQLGYAVLSALEKLPQAGLRYEYAEPVVSGATIGVWRYAPVSENADHLQIWRSRDWTLELPYRADLPTIEQTRAELAHWQQAEQAAQQTHDAATARDCRARVERMTRQLMRIGQLPPGSHFPLSVTLWRLGDGYWLMLEGEYYHALQRVLRERFPSTPLIVATVVNGWRPAYLPTRNTYGLGIYQEQVAVLAPGCLETVIEAVAEQIAAWQRDTAL